MKRATRQDGSGTGANPPREQAQLAHKQLAAAQASTVEPQTKELRKKAGTWLKEMRQRAGLSQIELAQRLGFKYYTFISQVENGFGRVPTESMEAWARNLGADPAEFTRGLLSHYEPELYRLLFEVKR